MKITDFFRRTPSSWLAEAKRVQLAFHAEAANAALRDVQRLQSGQMDSASKGEREMLEMATKKRVLHCIDKALRLDPSFAPAWFAKGEMLFVANIFGGPSSSELPALSDPDLEGALSSFEQAIAADPDLATALVYKADLLARKEQSEEALALYDEAIGLDASDVRAWSGKSRVLKKLGNEDEVRRCDEMAESVEPQTKLRWGNALYRWVSIESDQGA